MPFAAVPRTVAPVRMVNAEDHEVDAVGLVGDIGGIGRGRMHRIKRTTVAAGLVVDIVPEGLVDLQQDTLLFLSVGAVAGGTVQAWRRGIPVAARLTVQILCLVGQTAQGVAEQRRLFAGLDHAKADALVVDAPVRLVVGGRCGGHEDRPRNATRGPVPLQVRGLPANPDRGRIGAIDITGNDALPGIGQITQQFRFDPSGLEDHAARHDHRRRVAGPPQFIDHLRHQPQDAAGQLKVLHRAPGGIKVVEQVGMDRVGDFQLAPVILFRTVPREIVPVLPVESCELLHGVVALRPTVPGDLLEQATADDLVAFFLRRRTPGTFDPAKGLLEASQGFFPAVAADLGLRCWERGDKQGLRRGLDRLGQVLDEREVGVERPGRQALLPVDLPQVGDPLIDQDQTGGVFPQQRLQQI